MKLNPQYKGTSKRPNFRGFKALLSPDEWRGMLKSKVPPLDKSVIQATKLNSNQPEMTQELLTRKQLCGLFNLKRTSFSKIRKQPGFPERILPGTARAYRYDPVEVKAWFEHQEAIRQKLSE